MTPSKLPEGVNTESDRNFVDSALVEVVVPSTTNVALQDLFEAWDGDIPEDSTSMVPFIDQRQFLLLDELVTAYVVLRTIAVSEHVLKRNLPRLQIELEARAVGQQGPKSGDIPSNRDIVETLATETVNISDDPLICATEVQGESLDSPAQHMFLFWKVVIPIGRPRTRFPKLSIFFNPVAHLRPQKSEMIDRYDDYLPSNVPASINLMGPFSGDPNLEGISPHLAASKLHTSVPSTAIATQLNQSMKTGARRLFRAAPAFLWRIRFLRYPGLSGKNAIFACFDIEITQFAGCDVSMDKIHLQLSSGTVEIVSADLPHQCKPAEQFTHVYKLFPPPELDEGGLNPRTLTISLAAAALVSDECIPKIRLKWKTALEMPPSRPTSASGPVAGMSMDSGFPHAQDSQAMTGQSSEPKPVSAILPGISVNVKGPDTIHINEEFEWEVMIANRSDLVQRLAIIPVPQRKFDRHEPRLNSKKPIGDNWKDWLTDSVVDDNILYSMQKRDALQATDLVCLTPDFRLGSLAPSSCYIAQLKFLPLSEGVLKLSALRLVDLTTQQNVDINQLPDMVSVRRQA